MAENDLSGKVVDAAFAVHYALGPGLLESVYEEILAYELKKRGLKFIRQAPLPIKYGNLCIRNAFRIDICVENRIILELKATDNVLPLHKKQLLTYLKLSDYRLGLLINFNSVLLKDGITRMVNGL